MTKQRTITIELSVPTACALAHVIDSIQSDGPGIREQKPSKLGMRQLRSVRNKTMLALGIDWAVPDVEREASGEVKEPAPIQAEIVSPQGHINYRRPHTHPMIAEALSTEGYAVHLPGCRDVAVIDQMPLVKGRFYPTLFSEDGITIQAVKP